MRTPTQFPARAAIAAGNPQSVSPIPSGFPVRRNGRLMAMTAPVTSISWISHDFGGQPAISCIPLALAAPAGSSVPQAPGPGAPSGPGSGPSSLGQDRSGPWLRSAAAGLGALAAAAAAVSFTAQYEMADATRHLPVVATLEAAIPDTAALVFACLGIALALHG